VRRGLFVCYNLSLALGCPGSCSAESKSAKMKPSVWAKELTSAVSGVSCPLLFVVHCDGQGRVRRHGQLKGAGHNSEPHFRPRRHRSPAPALFKGFKTTTYPRLRQVPKLAFSHTTFFTIPTANMPELTISSKDDVECTAFVDAKDSSIQVGARYVRWVLGSVREDDILYMTKVLDGPPSGHSVEQIQSALGQVPGESIFPPLPIPWWFASTCVTVNDSWDTEPDPDVYYLKRPWLAGYDADHDAAANMPSRLAQWFACEIKRLEQLARHTTHPNLVHYHGCRVRNGRITAAILGRVPGDTLMNYAKAGKTIQDKEAFLRALESAVYHLHNVVGLVHNDIQPTNIMVSPDGTTPTLIGLGSASPEGEEIIHCPVPHLC